MITLEQAVTIAAAYYKEHGEQQITKVYDAKEMWIVFARKNGRIRYGSKGISISKISGEIRSFILPSEENFMILEAASLVDM